jgi:hypothetical protein
MLTSGDKMYILYLFLLFHVLECYQQLVEQINAKPEEVARMGHYQSNS